MSTVNVEAAITAYQKSLVAHNEIYRIVLQLSAKARELPKEECVDLILCMRKAGELMKSLYAEMERLEKYLIAVACNQWVTDATSGEAIVGEYARGTPDSQTMVKIPSFKDSPKEYEELCDYLGISPDLRDQGKVLNDSGEEHTKVVDIHWPGFQYYCSQLLAAGHKLPPGIDPDSSRTVFKMGIRKRKDLPMPMEGISPPKNLFSNVPPKLRNSEAKKLAKPVPETEEDIPW